MGCVQKKTAKIQCVNTHISNFDDSLKDGRRKIIHQIIDLHDLLLNSSKLSDEFIVMKNKELCLMMHLKKACIRSQLEEMQAFVGLIDSFDLEEAKSDQKETILEGIEFYLGAALRSRIFQNNELFNEKTKEEWEIALEDEIEKFSINRSQVKDEVEYKFKVHESTSGEGNFVKRRYFRSKVKNS